MNEINDFLINRYDITKKQIEFVENSIIEASDKFLELDKIREYNQYKVLLAFSNNKLSATDFYWTTGYGYGDIGRDKVESIYSNIFNTEDSLVRPSIASGTHAINLVLSGLLKHGDEMIEITGTPYDTLKDVIGLNDKENTGSLIDNGVLYKEVPLKDNTIDLEAVLNAIGPSTKLLAIQRSTGYSDRRAITIENMEYAISTIKDIHPNIIIFVDNCYGEFTDYKEPSDVGADIIAGSLIKNPGGGIAISGGYITGKKNLIELVANRLTSPGLGKEVGLSFGTTRSTLQGLFLGPLVVNQSLKGAVLLGQVYKKLGFEIVPEIDSKRSDIVQGIKFNNPEIVKSFCRSIQEASAVDSHVTPMPSAMPGYENEIIMAAGGFIDGSSIEMSADGPLREPYYVYYQGGLSIDQIKLAILISLKNLEREGFINIY
jgi:cystathionine beta-lyase family protein involved in aluminum resistance